jgi:uncharacterized spore protein YtfJ
MTMANVDEMFAGTHDAMTVKRVFGDPIESEGVTIVPAAKVLGAGGGGGDAEHNGGGGFRVGARPVGAYVIKGGEVTWQPAVDVNRIVALTALAGIVLALVLRR